MRTDHQKCQELLPLNAGEQKAFADRQLKLIASPKWPVTGWYNDEDFCRAYNTAVQLTAEIKRLQARLCEQTMQTQETAEQIHGRVVEAIKRHMTPPPGLDLRGHPIEQVVGTCLAVLTGKLDKEAAEAAEGHGRNELT